MASSKRRAKGEGSITRRSDGRWMGRYTVVLGDGTKKRQCVISKDRSVVAEKMRAEMAMADKGTPVLHSKRTTGGYLEYWLKNIAPNQLRPTTLHFYTRITQKYLMPNLGGIPLTQLKPEHIRMMLNRMKSDAAGDRTLQQVRNILSGALREALKLEYVTRNAARLVDPPEYAPPEKKVWTKKQVSHFLGVVKGHKHYPLFLLLLCYGLRRGEALGLRWADVDFGNGLIKIRQSLYEIESKPFFGKPKTKAGIRDLPMLPLVRKALLEHRAASGHFDDGLVFHSRVGKPVHPECLRKTFKFLAKQAGLPPLTLHETRHTAATLLAEAWPSPKEAQIILGHASIKTTLEIYTHSSLEKKAQALDALARIVF